MSAAVPPSLFFLQLPDLESLLSVTLTLQPDEEPRTRQIQTCRELVLLFQDVLASPALDSFSDITALMTIPFFHKGIVQAFAHRRHLQLSSPERVFPGDLQRCLSYSLVTRLAPGWNKAGLHLICGKDFLTERRRLNAVSLELSTSNNQLCLSVAANAVRLPPTSLEDLDLPPLVRRRLYTDPDSVVDLGSMWCHVLPSMKKGQIISISRRLPADGPFRTYKDLQSHWNLLYGYRLPELPEEDELYCSVHFTLLGHKLFTYPLSCVRLQPVQRCPGADPQGALHRFLSDIGDALRSVCGFPARLTSKGRRSTLSLQPASATQLSDGEQMNLSPAIRPVLTQLPPLPPPLPPPARPGAPLFGSQPPASTAISQQGGAVELADNRRGHGRLTQSQGCGGPSSSSSSSSSSSVCYSFLDFSVYKPAPHLSSSSSSSSTSPLPQRHAAAPRVFTSSVPPNKPSSSSTFSLPPLRAPLPLTFTCSSSTFHPAAPLFSTCSIPPNKPSSSSTSSLIFTSSPSPFQPASCLNSTSSLQLHRQACSFTTSSSAPPPPPPLPARPKLIPIFKNKHPSRHVNVALLRVQKEKEKEQMRNGREESGRVSLPPSGMKTSVTSTSAAPPSGVLRFQRRPGRRHDTPAPPDLPNVRRIASLSPVSKFKPRFVVAPTPQSRVKTEPVLHSETPTGCEKSRTKSSREPQEDLAAPSEPHASSASPSESPAAGRVKKVAFQKKPKKKSKPGVEDVEHMARNNQLSRLSSSSLTAWLKLRGLPVPARLKKDELLLKVMSCLAEA